MNLIYVYFIHLLNGEKTGLWGGGGGGEGEEGFKNSVNTGYLLRTL